MASFWLRVSFFMVYMSGYVVSLSEEECEQDFYFDKYISSCQPCTSVCSSSGSITDCHTYCEATCDRLLGARHTQDSKFIQCYQRPTAAAAVTSKRSASRTTILSPKSSNYIENVMSGQGIDSDEDAIDIDETHERPATTTRVPQQNHIQSEEAPKNSKHILVYVLASVIGVLVISNIVTLVFLLRERNHAQPGKVKRAHSETKNDQPSDNSQSALLHVRE